MMTWSWAFEQFGRSVLTRAELMAVGATEKSLQAAVQHRFLVRARRDRYLLPDTSNAVIQAVTIGGRIGCISALAANGVFVFDSRFTHVHMMRSMSRSRSPRGRHIALTPDNRDGSVLHWTPLARPEDANEFCVGMVDALAQAVRCQKPEHALASIDNALHLGLVTELDLADMFSGLPAHHQWLRKAVDGRAESGQESVLRHIVTGAGLSCELQVEVPTVGRVDMIVEGRLVVEADSRLAHDGWDKHVDDRRRDLVLASMGLASLRPAYPHIMYRPELIRDAILSLLEVR